MTSHPRDLGVGGGTNRSHDSIDGAREVYRGRARRANSGGVGFRAHHGWLMREQGGQAEGTRHTDSRSAPDGESRNSIADLIECRKVAFDELARQSALVDDPDARKVGCPPYGGERLHSMKSSENASGGIPRAPPLHACTWRAGRIDP